MNKERKSTHNQDNFNLDEYLEEQASAGHFDETGSPQKESHWFRNTLAILGLSIVTLLYFNDWNPSLIYGNIFGAEEYQKGFVTPEDNSTIVVIEESEGEPSIRISGLSGNSDVGNLDIEIAQITEDALANAFESLENLERLENLESLEGLENLEGLEELGNLGSIIELSLTEAFKELERLNESEILADNIIDYTGEFNSLGLNDKFTNSSIQKLYDAKIPSSFLKKLDTLGLLEDMTTESIIKAYETTMESENGF